MDYGLLLDEQDNWQRGWPNVYRFCMELYLYIPEDKLDNGPFCSIHSSSSHTLVCSKFSKLVCTESIWIIWNFAHYSRQYIILLQTVYSAWIYTPNPKSDVWLLIRINEIWSFPLFQTIFIIYIFWISRYISIIRLLPSDSLVFSKFISKNCTYF